MLLVLVYGLYLVVSVEPPVGSVVKMALALISMSSISHYCHVVV